MGLEDIFGLLGGLALFLYGMKMMSDGLEDVAGNKMKKILEKLTSNRFFGVAVGMVITAVIQSSSATTVMVVGFVNSGMMTLNQAVWIIMGANIGTTITGQLIALDIGMIAPLIAFMGVAMIVFLKSPKVRHIGKILAGLGVLFIGMNLMGESMMPLRSSDVFIDLMTKFNNPLLGILAGMIFTAIIQSSSASVGILQALAIAGLVDFKAAVFVLFGQNIGTCITAVLASIGTSRNAKRTTIIHLMFNLIGTAIFTTVCLVFPFTDLVAGITPNNMSQQIANMHTIFNIATTVVLLPFGIALAKLAKKILPDVKSEKENSLKSINEELKFSNSSLGLNAVRTDLLKNEITKMISIASENVQKAFDSVISGNISLLPEIKISEEEIDVLNKEISQFISKILVNNNNRRDVSDIEQYFLISGNAERIADHALNIAEYTKTLKEKSISFSENAVKEIENMKNITLTAVQKILSIDCDKSDWFNEINKTEEKIDGMTLQYRTRHLKRMHKGECSEEACILYSELLTDFERIGDHIMNIAESFFRINSAA